MAIGMARAENLDPAAVDMAEVEQAFD